MSTLNYLKDRLVRGNISLFLMSSSVIALICSFFVGAGIGYIFNEFVASTPYAILEDTSSLFERALIFGILGVAVVGWINSATGYDRGTDLWVQFGVTIQALIFAFIVDVVFQYITKQAFSRLWLIGSWSSAAVLMPLFYAMMVKWLDLNGFWKRNVVVIRSGAVERSVGEILVSEWPERFIILDEIIVDFEKGREVIEAKVAALEDRDCLFVFSAGVGELGQVEHLCPILEKAGLDFYIMPELGTAARRGLYQEMSFERGIPFIQGSNRLLKQSNQKIKRCLDIVLSLLILLVLCIPMLVLAFLIKKDGGSAIYGHRRVGRYGREFKCLKFRSMCVNADDVLKELLDNDPEAKAEWEKDFKLRDDPRVTKIGAFIRKTSIDELPQLLNVLKGEMSLVGPRPIVRHELENYYGEDGYIYTAVIPGITGLWQVSGRNNTSYEKRIDLDVRYARSWSVVLDLKILLLTPLAVFKRDGAY
ncbi:exopolysaccharide biosynthesis polyprenyl glycosylphosphotransferase [Terasakiella pusilla]|uniref:exopolysaccharide biosynthesis polyprenyl glycosylphosphotransferase n=1 Tax=Terasakiella pusilla TaxID=64973 RepID=UPI003AA96411